MTELARLRAIMSRSTEAHPQPEREGLRVLIATDGEALGNLIHAAYRGTADERNSAAETTHEIESTLRGVYGAMLWTCSFVITSGDDLTAACVVIREPEDPAPLIAYTATRPQDQRRGLARYLLWQSIHALFDRGDARVDLHVTAANTPAVRLYDQMGFIAYREYGANPAVD